MILMLARISDKVESLYDDIHSTVKYYSKLNHLKELFVIPHKRKKLKQKKLKEKVHTFVDPATGMQITTIVMGSGYDDDDDDDDGSEGTNTKGRGSVANKEPGLWNLATQLHHSVQSCIVLDHCSLWMHCFSTCPSECTTVNFHWL